MFLLIDKTCHGPRTALFHSSFVKIKVKQYSAKKESVHSSLAFQVVFKLHTSNFVPIYLVLWKRITLILFSVVTLF